MEPQDFFDTCAKNGVDIDIRGTVLTLSKNFPKNSNEGFTESETATSIIYEAPQTSAGSTWGTDAGSIGGYSGLMNGRMVMNRSGVSKRWLAKLNKIMLKK